MSETLLKVSCPSCETVFEVTDPSLIGQITACPKCGGMILIEDADSVSQGEKLVQDQRASDSREEESASRVVQEDTHTPSFPEVGERLDDVEAPVGTSKRIWRVRLVLVLAGCVCALVFVWASQIFFPSRAGVESQNMIGAGDDEKDVDSRQVAEWKDREDVESSVDDEEGDAVFRRDDGVETNEEFDARFADDLEETDLYNDSLTEETGDGEREDYGELDAVIEETGLASENPESDEVEQDEIGAISTEFDEEEFEKVNKNSEENEESDDEEEEDLGAVASTTDASIQSALPTLKQSAKEIDVDSRMKLRLSSITFPESPAAAVRLLAEFSGVPIDFDLKYFDLLRPSTEATLNLSLENVDVESALNELASLLKWDVLKGKDRAVLVPKEYDDALIEERFDVIDLLNAFSKKAPFEYRGEWDDASSGEALTLDVLSKMVSTLIAPKSWKVNGEGQGSILSEGTTMIVQQDSLNRKNVGDLFERLRALRELDFQGDVRSSALIAEALGWERLSRKISFNLLKPIALQQAIEILERTQKIQILWDDAVLNDFGVGRDATTVARIDEATIDQTLFDLLEPHKLTYVILDDNLFLITSKERAENYKTVEIHMYASEKQELSEEEARLLIDEMRTAVAPKSWNDPDVSLWIDFQSDCWIVRQSQPNQRAIRRWLDERLKH